MPMIGDRGRVPGWNPIRFVAPILFASILASLPAALQGRQATASPQLPPGVEVKIQAQPLEATVGDPIQFDLDFTLPQGSRLLFPQLPAQLGEFTVLQIYPGPEVPTPQTKAKPSSAPAAAKGPAGPRALHHHARIVAAVYETGEFDFPALAFALRDAGGKEVSVSTPPVHIRIKSVLAENDLALRDLKRQAEIPEPLRWLLWLVLGIVVLALALLAWWWVKRRRRPEAAPSVHPELDPLDLVEAELQALIGRGLREKGLIKQFYVDLSNIMKKALEASYGIKTIEKTTVEIIDTLGAPPETLVIGPEPASLERIETVLLSCDIVKFARYLPSLAEDEEVIKEASQILRDCRMRQQPAATAAVPAAGVS